MATLTQRYEPAFPIDELVEHPDNPRRGDGGGDRGVDGLHHGRVAAVDSANLTVAAAFIVGIIVGGAGTIRVMRWVLDYARGDTPPKITMSLTTGRLGP